MPSLGGVLSSVVVTALLTTSLFAQPAAPHRREPLERAGGTKAARIAPSPTVTLIVEFREPLTARAETLQQRVAQLRTDLAGFVEQRGIASNAAPAESPRIRRTFSRVLYGASLTVPRELVAKVKALSYVAAVHEARTFQKLSDDGVERINAKKVWTVHGTRGAGVTVAIIDTGVDYTHPAFGNGLGSAFKVRGGWDFVNDDADPMDDNGHGTHVAGIVAANGAGLTGVAPDASLIAYKVLDGLGSGDEDNIIAAIERAVDPDQNGDTSDHVDVINMSLGGAAQADDPTALAVENASAKGVLVVVANGNGGDYGFVPSPAIAPSAISVGAIDGNDYIADFSSRGPAYDYSMKPELVAPGVGILSSVPQGGQAEASGTSMASPHVAGVAALIKSLHHDWTPAEVKSAIVSTTTSLNDEVMIIGAGRVDALNAAGTSTLLDTASVNFGRVDPKIAVWRGTKTITLRNVSAATETLTANVNGVRNGIAVTIEPATMTLAPGEAKSATVSMALTNAAVPAPREGSLSFGGQIVWSGGSVPVHVPWSCVKGAFLTIEVENAPFGADAAILGDRLKYHGLPFGENMRILWRLEPVDVVVNGPDADDHFQVVVSEQVDMETAPTVHVNLRDARYGITTNTIDPSGKTMVQDGRECIDEIILGFPGKRRVSFEQLAGDPNYQVLFSSASPRVKTYIASRCGDVANNAFYVAMHETRDGISGDITSTATPRWLQQDVHFLPEVDATKGMTEAMTTMRFAGPEYEYFLDGGSFSIMRGTKPTLSLYYTPSTSPDVDLVSWLERWTECPKGGDCGLVTEAHLYLGEESIAVDSDIFLTVSPMAYRIPRGAPLTFGDAPVWPSAGFNFNPGLWLFLARWHGPLGEERLSDTATAKVAVYDANGTLLGDGTAGIAKAETLPPGRYRAESIDSRHAIGSVAGQAKFTGWVQNAKTDSLLPLFTGLRIVDTNDRQITNIDRNGHASLLFSATDNTHDERTSFIIRVPPREAATVVEYRQHGYAEWRRLPMTIAARHYENNSFLLGGVGTMFRVDLSSVAAELSGFVDLRLQVEDEDGNTSELLLEPAFSVGGERTGGRRRSVGH
ncbi:MAG TPA: S8 family serine peptidase [Thermoanaerobaculia bacterium]|nr:S8 family serine peptidase [Thermoanaerobaculia bacterium]